MGRTEPARADAAQSDARCHGHGRGRQGGFDFVWQATLQPTPNPAFRKVDIAVADKREADYRLARLSAYLSLSQ